ncbi:eEF1A lysine and N-terminal methyltransferase homolog isoform X2 [Musca vetustissima]|uniref:eEF1A lysine and N-terminal methyltransferase homolog isoform X2 n=1 Tax=Musca vetustissima TaxID=27455 RepID=UPI002AB65C02|nr:eEF1A lysine and N-terminal methyltransferase homolog isoform X2 [Musca vetustissima]
MNLLPKTHEEFATVDYWNTFFKKRGEKAFEWYGEYLELCEQIHKYIRPNDKILMVGCGNSKLSMDMYDSGFKDITNIDISAVAIKKMQEANARTRSDMKFIQMDATSMSFDNEQFSVALDKGTLDALFVDDTEGTQKTVEAYFKEIARVLRNGGRYVCISLLQEHILKYIIEYFPKNAFMLRIVHCPDADAANQEKNLENPDAVSMPVFTIVATKFKSLPMPILEFSYTSDKVQRCKSALDLQNSVKSLQTAAVVCNGLGRTDVVGHNDVSIDLCRPGENVARYTVHIVDQPPARGLGKYAVFLVPQGREVEWLFATSKGRRKLLEQSKFQRMAVVTLHREQSYLSMDEVKAELSDSVKSFAPVGLKDQIPYLSIGADMGTRTTLFKGKSDISGDFVVEEVEGSDGKTFRRLIFMSNQAVVQSEALIKKGKGKNQDNIDFGYLACQHHAYMSLGVQLIAESQEQMIKILVIGLGGGGLCMFLHEAVGNIDITAVDIDPAMANVAEKYFGLQQDERLHVVIEDGLQFLNYCRKEGHKYDAILFDVDSKDLTLGMSCPPPSFMANDVLLNLKSLLNESGLFILNLVCRDDTLRDQTIGDLKTIFPSVCSYKLDEDVNEIIYCTNNEKFKKLSVWKKCLGSSGRKLNDLTKKKKLCKDEVLDVTEFLSELKI